MNVKKTKKECEKEAIELTLHFEIRNSEMYGGRDSIGYAMVSVELKIEILKNIDVTKYAKEQKESVARMCKVDIDDIKIITKDEYEEKTKDEDE